MASFHSRKVANKVGLAWCHYPLQSPDDPINAYCYRRSAVIDCLRSGTYDGPTYQLINNQFLASKELLSANYWLNFGYRAHICKTFSDMK